MYAKRDADIACKWVEDVCKMSGWYETGTDGRTCMQKVTLI